jgi:prophage antirepressor-like protein
MINTKDNLEIMEFVNDNNGMSVRTILNPDGSVSMNAEDTAVGFGWTRIKHGKEYVKWDRLNSYIKDIGFSPQVGKNDFIPETLFYLLGMKASNDKAKEFQMWLAKDVIPSIRKHGAFIADSPNVDIDYVKNEIKFSTKCTIKTFRNADVSEIKSLYSEFKSYVDEEFKYESAKRISRYKSVEKGLQQLHDRLASEDISNVGDCYNIRKLKEQVILDRTTLEKRVSGGQKAYMTKRIDDLEKQIG